MAERKKGKKKGKEAEVVCEVPLKPTKEEYAIAKYLRSNLPTKRTKFLQHTVEFFISSKAVDMLMNSPWASDKSKTAVKFTTRAEIVDYMDIMLRHKFFHRARRVPVTARDLRGKALKKFQEEQEKLKELERRKAERERKKQESKAGGDVEETKNSGDEKSKSDAELVTKDQAAEDSPKAEDQKGGDAAGKGKASTEDKKGPKRRIKLEMHLDQQYVDGNEAYVWIYDPTPWYYWLLSIFVVLGAIALCLFPLWPSSVRKGVYYLSLAAAGFLIFILGLVVLRIVVFSFVWLITFGRHHLWLLPNLTEDVGFFASFWPLFQYEFKGGDGKDKKRKKKGQGKDGEESSESESESEEEDEDGQKQPEPGKPKKQKKQTDNDLASAPSSPASKLEKGGRSKAPEDDDDEASQSSRNSQQTDKEFEIIASGEATEDDAPDNE